MKIKHIVFTVFSIRGPGWEKKFDPLQDNDLNYRFLLFEAVCLPSIKGQTTSNFSWGIIIDHNLPDKHKNRLNNLISDLPHSKILHYTGNYLLNEFWPVQEILDENADYLILTNLDDDDAIPFNYLKVVQQRTKKLIEIDKHPPFKIIGNSNILQWDLMSSENFPFGTFSPWHRPKRLSSCGFTLVTKYPELKINILGLGHSLSKEYVNFKKPAKNANVERFQNLVRPVLIDRYNNLENTEGEFFLDDLCIEVPPVLMLNHFRNNQTSRIDEVKSWYKKVLPGEFSEVVSVNWELISRNLENFSLKKRLLFQPKKRIG